MGEILKNSLKYKLLFKKEVSVATTSGLFKSSRSVRTRVYVKEDYLNHVEKSPQYFKNNDNKKEKNLALNVTVPKEENKKLKIKDHIFRGAILSRLILNKPNGKKENQIPIAVVNTHLYYKHPKENGDDGIEERMKQFMEICKIFKLAKLYEEGYNIFFCGDLNFRIVPSFTYNKVNPYNPNPADLKLKIKTSENIIAKANINRKIMKTEEEWNVKNLYENVLYNNQLNLYMKNFKKTAEKIIDKASYLSTKRKIKEFNRFNDQVVKPLGMNFADFLQFSGLTFQFYINQLKFGLHLTCKIHEINDTTKKTLNNSKCYSKGSNSKIGSFECIRNNETKKYPIYPSMCDRILVSNHNNIKFEKNDYKILKDLRKSGHFMVTLTGNFNYNLEIKLITVYDQNIKKFINKVPDLYA